MPVQSIEAGKYYKHRYDPLNIYYAVSVEGIAPNLIIRWSWNEETQLRPYSARTNSNDYERFLENYTEVTQEGFLIPDDIAEEIVITKYVYIAYVKHEVRGTELALSGVTEEQLEHIIRGHPGYTVLAKKRIKFTL